MTENPSTRQLLEDLRSTDEVVWRQAATALLFRPDAFQELLSAITEGRYHEDPWSSVGFGLLETGISARDVTKVSNAETLFRALLRANPESAAIKNNLGVALVRLGRINEARPLFRSAFLTDLRRSPGHAFFWPAWKNYYEFIAPFVLSIMLVLVALVPAALVWIFRGPILTNLLLESTMPASLDAKTLITILGDLIQVNGVFIGFVGILAVFILQQVRADYRKWLTAIGISSLVWWFFACIADSILWISLAGNTAIMPRVSVTLPLENTTWGIIELIVVIVVTTRAPQTPTAH